MSSTHLTNLHLRAKIMRAVRSFFDSCGFLEVETPLRIPANAPEEHIDPYMSEAWFLQTSPEMCMKRLLSRGYGNIYQICHCWRSSERGSKHLPEFTMLEWYRTTGDYRDLMADCEGLLKWLACGDWVETGKGFSNNILAAFGNTAEQITVEEAFGRYASMGMQAAVREGVFDEIMVTLIEPSLPRNRPVILKDYPAEMAALARLKEDNPAIAERFELYVNGLELANGFSELIDPSEQLERFIEANYRRNQAGSSPLPLPEPFLVDLASMQPAAGIALGVDRLVMLLCGAERIDDVVSFTPEEL